MTTPRLSARARTSRPASSSRGTCTGVKRRMSGRATAAAIVPTIAPAIESTKLSARSCVASCRGDAPMATRTAISRSRDSARVSSSDATLRQPISSSKPTRPEQHHQRRAIVAKLLIEQGDESRAPPLVGVGKFLLQPEGHRFSGALRFVEGGAICEPADRFHEVRGPAVLMQVPAKPLPHVDVVGVMKLGRHHADDRVRCAVQRERAADDRRIAVVARAPQPIADHGDELALMKEDAGRKSRADLRLDAQHVKEVAAHLDGGHPHRIEARVHEVDARAPPRRRVLEDGQGAVIHEVDG